MAAPWDRAEPSVNIERRLHDLGRRSPRVPDLFTIATGGSRGTGPMLCDVMSLLNFRDVGGIQTCSGASVAHGRVYRSDGLTDLTPADREHLRTDLRIRTVVDLRSGLEHERLGRYDPALFGGTEILELPVLDGAVLRAQAARGDLDMTMMYHAIAFEGADRVRTALATLTEPERAPVMITCTGGKDRTGVTIAILLAALDVARDTILDDYTAPPPPPTGSGAVCSDGWRATA